MDHWCDVTSLLLQMQHRCLVAIMAAANSYLLVDECVANFYSLIVCISMKCVKFAHKKFPRPSFHIPNNIVKLFSFTGLESRN